MKLLSKINRQFITFSSISIIVGAIVIYYFIQSYNKDETEENLYLIKERAVKNINTNKNTDFYPILDIDTLSVPEAAKITDKITDTVLYDPAENEKEEFIQLTSSYIKDSAGYRITTRSTNLHNEDIILSIGVPVLALLLIILIISVVVINRISFSIWKPFYKNIAQLKKFSPADTEEITLSDFNINEFTDLNNSLKELTERIKKDYTNLKIFSENISHELQTPLAIIKTKTELMLQDPTLSGAASKQLQIINQTVNRLSKLNSSLILLIKIEGSDYAGKKRVNLNSFIKQKVKEVSEIADSSGITISCRYGDEAIIDINEFLLEILVSNLIANAIKHNVMNGTIDIDLSENSLTIKNTGKAPSKDTSLLFERFSKGNPSTDSTGLGLTIVKQICDLNKYNISYIYSEGYHTTKILFKV